MNRLLLTILSFTLTGTIKCFSQSQTERVQLNIGSFCVPKGSDEQMFKPVVRQIGLSYTHAVNECISLQASYLKWYNWNKLDGFIPLHGNRYAEQLGAIETWKPGDVQSRFDYQFVELSALYTLPCSASQELYAQAGLSYSWGYNDKVKYTYHEPGAFDWLVESETEKSSHLGGIAQIGYNYFLFKRRINLGVSAAMRYYPKLSAQYYTNVNVGYNFSYRKRH